MDTKKIIAEVGGRRSVMEMTELTKGRISQWVTDNSIPTPWLKFFQAKFPHLDWPSLLGKSPILNVGERRKFIRRKADREK